MIAATQLPPPSVNTRAAKPLFIGLKRFTWLALLIIRRKQDYACVTASCQAEKLLPHVFSNSIAAAMQHDRSHFLHTNRFWKAERIVLGVGRQTTESPCDRAQ